MSDFPPYDDAKNETGGVIFDQWIEEPPEDRTWDDSDYVTVRGSKYTWLRGLLAIVIIGAGFYFIGQAGVNWFQRQIDPEGEPGAEVSIVVPEGATTGGIGRLLESRDVVPNATFFRYKAQWDDQGNFQAGQYTMRENMSVDEAFEVLNAGPIPPVFRRFTVPEGLWISEVLPVIADQLPSVTEDDLRRALDAGLIPDRYRPSEVSSFEGLLFPDTYEVNEDADAVEVLGKMADQFAVVTGDLGYGGAETRIGYTAYEVLIIASLIEAEARTERDRPKIARVIYNRLELGIPLGIDATYVYDAGVRGYEILQSDIDDPDSPWNLRIQSGLPPHPIALPGRASLSAALNPDEGPWLFYVLWDTLGNHRFAETLEEHEANVAQARERGLF